MTRPQLSLALVFAAFLGCGPSQPPPRFASHPAGCPVEVFRGPTPQGRKAAKLGDISASCSRNDAESDCLRSLQDEVCKLGGNVVFNVPNEPEQESETSQRYTGLAGRWESTKTVDEESY